MSEPAGRLARCAARARWPCWPAAGRTCTTSRRYRGLRASVFFADGSSARPLVEGTVARGTLQTDEAFFTGKNGADRR